MVYKWWKGRHSHMGMLPKKLCMPPTILVGGWVGPCRGEVMLDYLSWRAGVSCRTWFQTCESWYLPKFLLREELLTEMYLASLMFLATPCGSLSTMEKHLGLMRCSVELLWWWMGDGALGCSLSLPPKALLDSPIYSSRQFICGHLNLYITLLFCNLLSLSLGTMRRVSTVFQNLCNLTLSSPYLSLK